MHQTRPILVALMLLLLSGVAVTATFGQESTPEPEPESTPEATPEPVASGGEYVVRPGDNLFRIALNNNTTVTTLANLNGITNPRLIYAGQRLRLPGGADDGQQQPPPNQGTGGTVTVQPGDTLNRIAAREGFTLSEILAVNDIANPNIIFPGQVITLPGDAMVEETDDEAMTDAEAETDETTQAPDEADEMVMEDEATEAEDPGITDAGFAYGIQAFFDGQAVDQVVANIDSLGVGWTRIIVDWGELEPTEGEFDFASLSEQVTALDAAGQNILFTVTNAPSWARTSQDENGPPDDLNNYFNFLEVLAEEYSDTVDAYQIWDEPNLRRNWNCERRMCDTDYLFMLGESYALLEDVDEDALVISAGLAPTRFNDRINAINDQLYLETMLSRGLETVVDGIGIHPGGEANPPDAECCDQPPGVESHFESDSFYFLENLEGYRALIVEYDAADIPLWVTKFGWGTAEDPPAPSNENQPHYSVNYTSLSEQAVYVPRAFELGQELSYVGPMFLYNLNGCAITEIGGLPELCYTSLTSPTGDPRPVYLAVEAIEK